MTRICEKHIEELTSGNSQFSPELTEHLAACPECRLAAESMQGLKAARKPISGREAAAIATIIKAVNADAAAATAAPAATKSSLFTAFPKYLFILLLAAASVATVAINFMLRSHDHEQKEAAAHMAIEAAKQVQPANSTQAADDFALPDSQISPSPEINSSELRITENKDKIESVASAGQNAEEVTASEASKVMMISPDQEDVNP